MPFIVKETAKILDLQDPTAKMSKSSESQAGVVDILDEPAVIAKKIKRAVTDTGTEIRFDPEAQARGQQPADDRLDAVRSKRSPQLEADYQGKGYGALKTDVADLVVEFATPLRERTLEWLDEPARLAAVLAQGAERARAVAGHDVAAVYDAVGFLPAEG